jgi:hypothetical protein
MNRRLQCPPIYGFFAGGEALTSTQLAERAGITRQQARDAIKREKALGRIARREGDEYPPLYQATGTVKPRPPAATSVQYAIQHAPNSVFDLGRLA